MRIAVLCATTLALLCAWWVMRSHAAEAPKAAVKIDVEWITKKAGPLPVTVIGDYL